MMEGTATAHLNRTNGHRRAVLETDGPHVIAVDEVQDVATNGKGKERRREDEGHRQPNLTITTTA